MRKPVRAGRLPIRGGRVWVPVEWRDVVGVRFRHSAIVAVTGVRNRNEAAAVLEGHLPRVPLALFGPIADDAPADDADAVYAPGDDDGHTDDVEGAARIAKRLHPGRGEGLRELVAAQMLPPTTAAVYVWRRAAPNELVYRLYPTGEHTIVASFTTTQRKSRSGHMRPALAAQRYSHRSNQWTA
jgi:hypothetical protein